MKLTRATDTDLSEAEIHIGLLEHGLFAEKMPPCFTSRGLIAAIGTSLDPLLTETDPDKLRKALNKTTHDFARYSVLREINVPRLFGLPHPESYAVQCLFIRQHWKLIRRHNLRASNGVSRIHVRRCGSGRVFVMNYQGMFRAELEEEEVQWAAGTTRLVKADISACFASKYTHSIPWALHGRVHSKKNRGLLALPGNILDKVTQGVRDGQTNGLLIGPHSSNVISEIILTRIDKGLRKRGYARLKRYIDDYQYYADSEDEALRFLHDLGVELRQFEMSLNEKKTRILVQPQPSAENWSRDLKRFDLPKHGDVRFSTIRAFLDLALDLSLKSASSAPLNYALKMLPETANQRAKRLAVQEAINLALIYPYLAPLLGKHVFEKYDHAGIEAPIKDFTSKLVKLGVSKLYPDAIAYAVYYATRYGATIDCSEQEFEQAIRLDDCIVNVLLNEYATRNVIPMLTAKLKNWADRLKGAHADERDVDKQWLFVYQMWTEAELRAKKQEFLADLKAKGFNFIEPAALVRPTLAAKKRTPGSGTSTATAS